jgi:uncharacterized membrane protein
MTETHTNDAYHLITWLVNIMTNSFFFATKERTKTEDSAHAEMLILARNNGNRELENVLSENNESILYQDAAAGFKVRRVISLRKGAHCQLPVLAFDILSNLL